MEVRSNRCEPIQFKSDLRKRSNRRLGQEGLKLSELIIMSDEEYVANKRPNRIYFSREIPIKDPAGARSGRYASRIFETNDREHFSRIEDETVIRVTHTGREQIKAFFLVDDRKIRTLTLQRFSSDPESPREEAHFSLVGEEIQKLLDLALLIRTSQFDSGGKTRLEEGDLEQISLSRDAAKTLLKSDVKMLTELLEHGLITRERCCRYCVPSRSAKAI